MDRVEQVQARVASEVAELAGHGRLAGALLGSRRRTGPRFRATRDGCGSAALAGSFTTEFDGLSENGCCPTLAVRGFRADVEALHAPSARFAIAVADLVLEYG